MSATHALRVVHDIPFNHNGNMGPHSFEVKTTEVLAKCLAESFTANLITLRHLETRKLTPAERKADKQRMDAWNMEGMPS